MISNSSPIIFLAKIDQLELLKKLFNFIMIPESVKKEILIVNKPEHIIIKEAIKKGWIRITGQESNIDFGLDKGENEALNIAREKNDYLIIDDLKAIKIAISLNIECIRTTDIIFLALKKKIINKNKALELIEKLVKASYYISPSVYAEIISTIREFK